MSESGAQIDAPIVPPAGSTVNMIRGSLSVEADVAWSAEHRCGLRFSTPVRVREWMANSHSQQQRVDQIIAAARARSPAPHHDGQIAPELGSELARICALLENLSFELASDAQLIAKHAANLQNFDIALQSLAALARRFGQA